MLGRAGLAFCLVVASACAGPALAQTKVTRGTVSLTATEWPTIVAQKKGFYEKEGLKVEEIMTSPTTITPTLIGGSIQFGFINASQLIIAIEAEADLVAIGKGSDPSPYSLVTVPAIKSVKDLKGKTIALAEQGDAYAEATRDILRKNGLDPDKDVNIRYGGNSNQRMAALTTGAIDAAPVVPPQDTILLAQGLNAVAFYPDYFPDLALSLTAVRRQWAKDNPDTVRAFMRAQAASYAWLNNPANKDEAIKYLMEATKADQPSVAQAYDVYVNKLKAFATNGCIGTKGIEMTVEMVSRTNKTVKSGTPVSKYIDTQYCPK